VDTPWHQDIPFWPLTRSPEPPVVLNSFVGPTRGRSASKPSRRERIPT
jgi:hypothetical protein